MTIFEYKNKKKLFIWAIFIFLFSILGYLAYVIFGNNLKFNAKQQLIKKRKSTKNYLKKAGFRIFNTTINNKISNYITKELKCTLWQNNSIKIFDNGIDFFNNLLIDINSAKNHIHLEFFIFADDTSGKILAKALIEKAKLGVDVKIIYDAFGSRKTSKQFWKKLKDNGIKVQAFFPPLLKINILNFKINYRNHRKIVVIDGKTAYTGGINIRNDHMNKNKKLSPWRDTQIKIEGSAVYSLQDIFLNDWCFCNNIEYNSQELTQFFPKISNFFCPIQEKSNTFVSNSIIKSCSIQVIEDGPDYDNERILSCYIKIINNAKKFVYIQTPYFIINDELCSAIINAYLHGVNICIFLPKKPDKKLVYGATLLNIKKIFLSGINIYLYKGFIHSKVLMTENEVCIGSCNFDYRSFFLNFETTCICYNKNFINKNIKIIKNDINNSLLLTKKLYKKLKSKNIFLICFYKIISKIL